MTFGPCAKVRIRATIRTPDGRSFVGFNDCDNAQRVCPREPGDNYFLCQAVCRQEGHAEVMALKQAGPWAVGATAFVEHKRCCPDCQQALNAAGVARIVLGEPG